MLIIRLVIQSSFSTRQIIFAFIPPTNLCGGWLSFFVSLVAIGCLTAVVGDLATIFGCLVGLKDSVTAITFVAMGTSVPDLFASKQAATMEKTADNSIGNVTGSNSVNVFLGLGVPWVLAALYWASQVLLDRIRCREYDARFKIIFGFVWISKASSPITLQTISGEGLRGARWYFIIQRGGVRGAGSGLHHHPFHQTFLCLSGQGRTGGPESSKDCDCICFHRHVDHLHSALCISSIRIHQTKFLKLETLFCSLPDIWWEIFSHKLFFKRVLCFYSIDIFLLSFLPWCLS